MKRIQAVVVASILFLGIPSICSACACKGEEINIRDGDVAFIAQVESFTHFRDFPFDEQVGVLDMKLRVVEVLRGEIPERVRLSTSAHGCNAVWGRKGEEVGIVLVEYSGELSPAACPQVRPQIMRDVSGPGHAPRNGELALGDARPSPGQWVVHSLATPSTFTTAVLGVSVLVVLLVLISRVLSKRRGPPEGT